jgi:hypothetical protein
LTTEHSQEKGLRPGVVAVYTRKGGHDTAEPADDERIDAEEFIARVLVQIPDPRRHLLARGSCRPGASPADPKPQPRLTSPRLWAHHHPMGRR